MKKRTFIIIIFALAALFISTYLKKGNIQVVCNNEETTIGEDELWVEADLNECRVIIRKGNEIIKEFKCSGGKKEEPTVTGIYKLENRGEWFYSEKYNEGALYWVRFYEQYLFHSVPVDKDFNVIEEEKEKIGTNASHGCIRLLEEDAKWFYFNVPDGTKVVIHY